MIGAVAGASSLHLWWDVPGPATSVAATVTVLVPPADGSLVFWALQATFADRGRRFGGAHVGLQAHAAYPGGTAVNWGGYGAGGRELEGTVSALPSALGNANTRDFRWEVGRPYRLSIVRSAGGWAGLVDGTEVRTLRAGGTELVSPVVWTESFAPCAAPPVLARWSNLSAVLVDGSTSSVRSVRTGFTVAGCRNTTSFVDGDGFGQMTGVERSVRDGEVLTRGGS